MPAAADKPVRTPGDFEGLRFGTFGSQIPEPVYARLGADAQHAKRDQGGNLYELAMLNSWYLQRVLNLPLRRDPTTSVSAGVRCAELRRRL